MILILKQNVGWFILQEVCELSEVGILVWPQILIHNIVMSEGIIKFTYITMLPKDDCFQANRLQMLATIEMLSVYITQALL